MVARKLLVAAIDLHPDPVRKRFANHRVDDIDYPLSWQLWKVLGIRKERPDVLIKTSLLVDLLKREAFILWAEQV